MKILLCRHGESEYNVARMIGGNSNITYNGKQFAKKLHNYLEDIIDLNIFTSTLNRTKQTATFFNQSKKELSCLDEINAGNMDGMTYEEIKKTYPIEFELRKQNKLEYRYPKGESYLDLRTRVLKVLNKIKEDNKDNNLIICHQAVLRVLFAFFNNLNNSEIPYLEIPLHHIFILEIDNNFNLINKKIVNLN